MGVITPVGNDLQTFWTNLVNGVSGIGPITHFDVSAFDCRIAGQVRDFEAVNYFKDKKGPKRTDRFVHLAVAAAKLSFEVAGASQSARAAIERAGGSLKILGAVVEA